MAEYINRERARFEFERFFKAKEKIQNDCDSLLCMLPTADVVEIVRCSECKHYHDPMRCALWYGTLGDNEYFLEHGKDFYCAFGERRSE